MTAALLVDKDFSRRQAEAAYLRGVALDRLRDDRGRVVYVATLGAQTCAFDSLEKFDDWLAGLPVTLRGGAR